MRKSRVSVAALLSLLMVLVLSATALAAGGSGSGGGKGAGDGGGSGDGKSALNVVSVQVDGADLEGSTVAPGAVIRITFDRGMKDNFAANAALIHVYAGETAVDAAVAQGEDKSVYTITLPAELAEGSYALVIGAGVMANNGNTLGSDARYSFTVEAPATPVEEEPAAEPAIKPAATPAHEQCVLSDWTLVVNGVPFDAQAYNVDGYNYYKLRDIALALSGTANRFSVSWDEATGVITAVSGEAYVPDGSEQHKTNKDKSDTCVPSTDAALFNGVPSTAYAYNIGGNNFFKLRDLAAAFGFSVDYDPDARTAMVTTSDYVAPGAQ